MLGPANTGLGACDWVRCTPATNCTPFLAAPPESTKPRPLPAAHCPGCDCSGPQSASRVGRSPHAPEGWWSWRPNGRTECTSVVRPAASKFGSRLGDGLPSQVAGRVRTELARLGQARPCGRSTAALPEFRPNLCAHCAVPREMEQGGRQRCGSAGRLGVRFHSIHGSCVAPQDANAGRRKRNLGAVGAKGLRSSPRCFSRVYGILGISREA
jgi:hypothetical protein